MHSGYSSSTVNKDIALLKLTENLTWTDYVRPICMPTSAATDGSNCAITGWGDTEGKFGVLANHETFSDFPGIRHFQRSYIIVRAKFGKRALFRKAEAFFSTMVLNDFLS